MTLSFVIFPPIPKLHCLFWYFQVKRVLLCVIFFAVLQNFVYKYKSMGDTLIEQLINKMGLWDEKNVLHKTTELFRLLELRSTNVPLQVNEYGKIILCADLAAAMLGTAFDKEQALKLSGLRKSQYINHKRMFEKLLDLNKILNVKDICIQLNITEVSSKAEELLKLYHKVLACDTGADIDMTHPQYAAMAVFQAAKLLKKKLFKGKVMLFSNLRPTQWQLLERKWDQFIAQHYKSTAGEKLKQSIKAAEDCKHADSTTDKKEAITKVETEDYETWKRRMLCKAENELKLQQQSRNQMEKENMLLGQ